VPRFVPATVHELARVQLFTGIPGQRLAELAGAMRREEIAPGAAVVQEGEVGDRFYVVLSGVLTVSQQALGPRRVLRPGDTFGEVALAMDVPRTASVRAMTPVVVASCDREAFDRYVRPLFADDR
jgi:potassium efflux system protein